LCFEIFTLSESEFSEFENFQNEILMGQSLVVARRLHEKKLAKLIQIQNL
jgi:hypothetical protein